MKVYIVIGGWDYSGAEPLSAWETEAEASAEITRLEPFKRWDSVGIETLEIGQPIDMSQFRASEGE